MSDPFVPYFEMSPSGIEHLTKALSAAQAEIEPAPKNSANPFFKSKYSDLSAVWQACRAALTKQGLSIIQPVTTENNRVVVCTILCHSSGQWVASSLALTPKAQDPQSLGSAISYGRRYGLSAMVGISSEDDDGNAATHNKEKENGKDKKVDELISGIVQAVRVDEAAPPKTIRLSDDHPITGKQSNAIYAISKSKNIDANDLSLKKFNKKFKELSTKEASLLIDELQKEPVSGMPGEGWPDEE